MNLAKFLSSVDSNLKTMDKNQLEVFIHDIARVLPENNRMDFLIKLGNCRNPLMNEKEYEEADQEKYKQLKDALGKIENGEMCLSGELNEEYDDWYNSEEDEFLFYDPQGVGEIIENACGYVHESVEMQRFKEGKEIAGILMGLRIIVDGEYQEYADEPLVIEELQQYNLAKINYKKLVVESLYLTYCSSTLENRADAMYNMIQNAGQIDITLEMIMQCGEELPGFQEFLPNWIAYLGEKNDRIAQTLLDEALNLSNDTEDLLASARAYYKQHPGLYEKYIRENQNTVDAKSLVLVGKEALSKIDSKYLVRSQIALLLADIELKTKGEVTEEIQALWLEAFRSDTRVVNYLRMLVETDDFSKWKAEMQEINHKHFKKSSKEYSYHCPTALQENSSNKENGYLIALLNGEYSFVKEQGMNFKEALGWSASYMKNGLAAFLLFLFKSKDLAAGTNAMLSKLVCSVSFKAIEYEQGIIKEAEESDKELFWRCFNKAKSLHPMTEREQDGYLKWIEKLIQKRVNGIMEGNHRKYYGECAEYIAALGEVVESRGIMRGKQKILLEYKQSYSRRRAFHEELRRLGMKDR